MPLTYVTVTGTFDDGTGTALSGTATFTPSATVYAAGVPLVTPGGPVSALIVAGALKNSSGGALTLLATDNTGLTVEGQTAFWFWTVSLTVGGTTQGWSFFLPKATSPVELFSLSSGYAGSLYVPLAGGTMTGELVAPDVNISGLTGATAASRYVGGTASGAPASGTFAVGDFVIDHAGKVWICTSAGTPGTWTAAGPTIPVTIGQGGTGQATQQAALDALAGVATSGNYLRGNGTHVAMSAIQAADLPYRAWQFHVAAQGAKGDGRRVIDAATTTGASSNFTSATAAFTAGDVGKVAYIAGAGAAGAHLTTTISAYVNSTTVTLAATPGTAVSSKFALIGTDDTSAVKSAASAAVTYAQANDGYAEVLFDPAIYVLNGSATIGGSTAGNAIIPLPAISTSAAKVTLAFKGSWGDSLPHWLQATPEMSGTTLACTNLAGTNDATYGPAFVIGGPWNGYGDSTVNFSNMCAVVEGIRVSTPFNGTFGGFGFWGLAQARVIRSSYMPMAIVPSGGAAPQFVPNNIANQWTIGLLMPSVNNNDLSDVNYFSAYGATYGFQPSEHCNFDNIRVNYNIAGISPVCGGGGIASHIMGRGGYVSAEANVYGIGITYGDVNSKLGGYPKFSIDCLDVESNSSYHIHDPSSHATAYVGTYNFGQGYLNSAAYVSGAAYFRIIALEQVQGPVSSPQAAPSSTAGWVNYYYRDAEITLSVSGGTLSALSITNAAGATSQTIPASATFYRFTLPSGNTYTPTYTGALTHTVTLL